MYIHNSSHGVSTHVLPPITPYEPRLMLPLQEPCMRFSPAPKPATVMFLIGVGDARGFLQAGMGGG